MNGLAVLSFLIICSIFRLTGPIVIHVYKFGVLNKVVQFVNNDKRFVLDGGGVAWFWPCVVGHPDSIEHETIHFNHQCELLVLPFFILYGAFGLWLWRKHGRSVKAYRRNPFERAARARDRRPYSWIYYLRESE